MCFIELADYDENMTKMPKKSGRTRRSKKSAAPGRSRPPVRFWPLGAKSLPLHRFQVRLSMNLLFHLSQLARHTHTTKLFRRALQTFPLHLRRLSSSADAEFRQPPSHSALCANVVDERYDLHIIVPVYNVERYVEGCIASILAQQTRFSFHITVVNDGSSDKSRERLRRYEDDPRVTIIDQENRGFSGARNAALAHIVGRYVMFVDSDDRLAPGAVEMLMSKAVAEDLDIVQGGYVRFFGCAKLPAVHPVAPTGFAWGKVYRASLWRRVHFPETFWYEDTVCGLLLHALTQRVGIVGPVVYEYRINLKGISIQSMGRPKCMDTLWVTQQLLADRDALGLPDSPEFLNAMLPQVRINTLRVFSLGDSRANALNFALSRRWVVDRFAHLDARHVAPEFADLYRALIEGDAGRLVLLSLFP